MRNAWALTKVRMRLMLRNRAFLVFSLFVPMLFLFLFLGLLARDPNAARYRLASVLSLTVMGSFWGLSVQLVTFREQGILRRFRLAPVSAGAMLASSILSNYIMTLPTVFIEFALAHWLFHMQIPWGNLVGVWVLVTLGITTFAALGLIVASITNTMQETQLINQLLWWAFLLLSGATIPLPLLPGWLQSIAVFIPATYLVSGFQTVMIGRGGVLAIGPEIASLAVSTAVAFVVSQQLFRWEPEAKVPRNAKLWAASALIPFLLLGIWESGHDRLRATSMMDYQSITSPSDTDK